MDCPAGDQAVWGAEGGLGGLLSRCAGCMGGRETAGELLSGLGGYGLGQCVNEGLTDVKSRFPFYQHGTRASSLTLIQCNLTSPAFRAHTRSGSPLQGL